MYSVLRKTCPRYILDKPEEHSQARSTRGSDLHLHATSDSPHLGAMLPPRQWRMATPHHLIPRIRWHVTMWQRGVSIVRSPETAIWREQMEWVSSDKNDLVESRFNKTTFKHVVLTSSPRVSSSVSNSSPQLSPYHLPMMIMQRRIMNDVTSHKSKLITFHPTDNLRTTQSPTSTVFKLLQA